MIKRLFEICKDIEGISIEFGYNKIADYVIVINHRDNQIAFEQDCDINMVLAKAYVKLTEYMCEKFDGY